MIIGVIVLPLYIKYMGAEAYGLVGFFLMLQTWFNLLDLGLTPTISRETARFYGGSVEPLTYRKLVRTFEVLFFITAVLGGSALFFASGFISTGWLQAQELPIDQVKLVVQLMAISVALRWMCGLYRGIIIGSELIVWLSGFNAIIATIRFIGVFVVLIFLAASPAIFFGYQLAVAVLELVILIIYAHLHLPFIPIGERLRFSLLHLKPVIKFSLTMAFPTIVWVLICQTDKLVLSKVLNLTDYGFFTLAVLVASVVISIGDTISTSLMPRMAKLEAEGDQAGLIHIYRQSTQLVAVIAGTMAVTLAYFAEPLLWIWTGDKFLAHQAAPILVLYALGNGILAVSAFPFYLQYAKGDLRLHLIGNFVFVILLVPTIIYAAYHFGGVGAGYVWLFLNILSFVAWLPLVHRKFAPGLNITWYFRDVLAIFMSIAMVGCLLHFLCPNTDNRWTYLGCIVLFGAVLALVGLFTTSIFLVNCQRLLSNFFERGKRELKR